MAQCSYKLPPVERHVDIVFCIDGTGGMRSFINMMKDNLSKGLFDSINSHINQEENSIVGLRIKIIVFRDYALEDAMYISRFYSLPEEQDGLVKEISNVDAYGGADEPDNGLEALYFAFKSDWVNGNNDRQITMLFTDSEAHELKEREKYPSYPKDMVDIKGLCNYGNTKHKYQHLKRLIIFAPSGTRYEKSLIMDRCYFYPVEAGNGLTDIDFETILSRLSRAINS